MQVRVFEIVKEERPLVFEVNEDCETAIDTTGPTALDSPRFPPTNDDNRKIRHLTDSDHDEVKITKIPTPSYQTILHILEMADGSIAIRVLNVEVVIIPDSSKPLAQYRANSGVVQ